MTVAALYVDTARGPYPAIPGVECWGFATRDGSQIDAFATDLDARSYAGPHPVVAHPPCGPWGRFWWNYKGGEGSRSCGLRAADQVREWGGLLEHPEHSGLWKAAGPADAGGRARCARRVHRARAPMRLRPPVREADVALRPRHRTAPAVAATR